MLGTEAMNVVASRPSYWQRTVRELERSKLTHEEFAQQHGLNVGSLRSWLYRIRRESQRAVQIQVRVDQSGMGSPQFIEISVTDGVVRIGVGAENAALRTQIEIYSSSALTLAPRQRRAPRGQCRGARRPRLQARPEQTALIVLAKMRAKGEGPTGQTARDEIGARILYAVVTGQRIGFSSVALGTS